MLRVSDSTYSEDMCRTVYQLWKQGLCTDCSMLCVDGTVQASKLVLSIHSDLLSTLLEPDEVSEIFLPDFSVLTVRGLMGLLHGESGSYLNQPLESEIMQEYSLLMKTLGVHFLQEEDSEIVNNLQDGFLANQSYEVVDNEEEVVDNEEKVGIKEEAEEVQSQESTNLRRSGRSSQGKHSKFGTKERKTKNATSGKRTRCESKKFEASPSTRTGAISADMDVDQTIDDFMDHLEDDQVETEATKGKRKGRKRKTDESYQDAQIIHAKKTTRNKDKNPKQGKFVTVSELEELSTPYLSLGSGGQPYSCTLCSFTGAEQSLCLLHVGLRHLGLMTLVCRVCGFLGNDVNLLEKHLNEHGLTREKDRVGAYRLVTQEQSNVDILEERFKPFYCEFCSKLLKGREEGNKHQEECGGGQTNIWYNIISNSRYQCKLCPSVLKNKVSLKSHLAYTHNQTLPFVCDTCGDSFLTSNMKQFHNKKRHGKAERKQPQVFIGNYHLKQYNTYLPKEKAEVVLLSYYTTTQQGNECRICENVFSSEDIRSHLLRTHLRLSLYKCELCSAELVDQEDYQDHIQSQHNVQEIKTVELPVAAPDTEFLFVQEDEQEGHEERAVDPLDTDASDVAYVIHQKGDEPIIEEEKDRNSEREEISSALVASYCTAETADQLIKKYLYKPVRSKIYYCKICNKDWFVKNFEIAKNHVLTHLNLYLYKCAECDTLFKKEQQLRRHMELHKFNEIMVGNYHLLETPVFVPWREAKQIIDSYYRRNDDEGYCCLLCNYSNKFQRLMRNHLLAHHLKINIFQCQVCEEELSLESDIKKHLMDQHKMEFEGLEKMDDPEYESTETEIETDDIRQTSIDELCGKKVSSAQGRILRKLYVSKNAAESKFECQLCGEKKESLSHCCDHVMSTHLDVYIYRCAVCRKLLRNWSIYSRHRTTHDKPSVESTLVAEVKVEADRMDEGRVGVERVEGPGCSRGIYQGNAELELQYHLLEQDLYVGSEEGMRIVREYMYQVKSRTFACKLCNFQSLSQGVESHVFAKHLVKLYLYRCDKCGKMIRYSKTMFKNHLLLHSTGKLSCTLCLDLDLNQEKRFTRESLAAHIKRFHTQGDFQCKVESCAEWFPTPGELRVHERTQHQLGLPQKVVEFLCQICEHSFPSSSQLQTHATSCRAGRSRTLFRQLIADSLTWEGNGVYRCKTCGESFHPPRPTCSSLPLARKHVVQVHNKTHLRRTKMTWTQGVEGLNLKKKAARRSIVNKDKVAASVGNQGKDAASMGNQGKDVALVGNQGKLAASGGNHVLQPLEDGQHFELGDSFIVPELNPNCVEVVI